MSHRALSTLWIGALVLVVAVLAVPDPGTDAAQFGVLVGYPAQVLDNVYRMIRVGMPWLPAGLLLALVLPIASIRRGVLLALGGGAMLAFAGGLGAATGLGMARDLLFVLPGVAAGMWLAQRSRALATGSDAPDAAVLPAAVLPAAAPTLTRASNWPHRIAGGALLAGGAALAATLPGWGVPVAVGLAAFVALLWWRPLWSLVAVAAALPLLDLAPWTGRVFADEFDALLLVTAGMLMLRRPPHRAPILPRFAGLLITLFLVAAATAAAIGLLPLAPIDANAFASYWSPYNALRVAKGFAWGLLLLWITRRAPVDEPALARLLAIGMGIGLLGVGLVGVWERWLFGGLDNAASTYRIVSTFSSMHTGGGHIEAWLVAAVPFVWLGLFRWRSLWLAAPVLVLSAYVMLYTVARGGVLAFAVVAAILAVATVRTSHGASLKRAALPALALAGVTAVVVAGAGGGYLMQRFERVAEDWQIRVDHWQLALRIADDSLVGRAFGSGLGSFPRKYLERGPADQQAATYAFMSDDSGAFLRLGVGDTLYMAQRVDVAGGTDHRLSLSVRSSAAGALSTPLCEKQLLNSRRCDWNQVEVAGDGQWHRVAADFSPTTVGKGPPWSHLPVELYFHNVGKGGVIDVAHVALLDAQGRDLVANGDFRQGSDFWFSKTHSHLPWHIKNLWVHTYFEMGAVGLLLLVALVMLATWRLARAGWRGSRLAWAMLASLAGMLVVGTFDSLLDAPRLAMVLIGWLFVGAGWQRPRAPRRESEIPPFSDKAWPSNGAGSRLV